MWEEAGYDMKCDRIGNDDKLIKILKVDVTVRWQREITYLESESRTYIHVYVCWQESHAGILLYCATATTCIMLT